MQNKHIHIPVAAYSRTDISNASRNTGLDIIRALALIVIVTAHTNNYLGKFTGAYRYVFSVAFIAQDLYFGLSGFLVGGQILKQINTNGSFLKLLGFYKNRWTRTIPFYLVFLAVNYLLFLYVYPHSKLNFFSQPVPILNYLFFTQNFASAPPVFFPEVWPLPIEEWSFLLLPLPIFLYTKLVKKPLTKKQLLLLLFVELALANFIRADHVIHTTLETDWDLRKVVLYRLDALLYGFLLSLLADSYRGFFTRHGFKLMLGSLITCFLFYFASPVIGLKNYQVILFFLFPLLTSLAISYFYFHTFPALNLRIKAWLTHISLISYAVLLSHLYCIQFSLLSIYIPQNLTEGIIFTMIYFAILLVFGTAFFNYIERPILLLRKKQL